MHSPVFHNTKQVRSENLTPTERIADNHFTLPSLETRATGFDFATHMATRKGPAIEVGGPTSGYGYGMLPNKQVPADAVITNITNDAPEGIQRNVDLLLDAAHLPFADGSLGSLFAAYLPFRTYDREVGETIDLHRAFLGEAARTLEPEGLLTMYGSSEDEIVYAAGLGLTPVQIVQNEGYLPASGKYEMWDVVFMRAADNWEPALAGEGLHISPEAASGVGSTALSGVDIASDGVN